MSRFISPLHFYLRISTDIAALHTLPNVLHSPGLYISGHLSITVQVKILRCPALAQESTILDKSLLLRKSFTPDYATVTPIVIWPRFVELCEHTLSTTCKYADWKFRITIVAVYRCSLNVLVKVKWRLSVSPCIKQTVERALFRLQSIPRDKPECYNSPWARQHRVPSGWAKDCCYFLLPIYVHIVYWYDNLCTRVA